MAFKPDRTDLALRLGTNRGWSFEYQERRHSQWRDNYALYRDTVITNRLTQRQSVNVPLMKETVKTILSRIDETPDVKLENLGGDDQAELYANEAWKQDQKDNSFELIDIVDKKQVLLTGRSFRKLNIVDGKFKISVEDPQDILVDKFCKPYDIETANSLIHQHIYRDLRDVLKNKNYDQTELAALKTYIATKAGIIKSEQNRTQRDEKNDKLKDMGFTQVDEVQVGNVVVELTEHFVKIFNEDTSKREWWVITEAEAGHYLMVKSLEEVLGIDFLPFVTWADDIDNTDFWSDGVGDIVRVPNQVLNCWVSQLVENRTLRNFGMNFYDATFENFVPQTFEAVPFGWYPMPGDPNKIIKRVEIEDLSSSLDEISLVTGMVERASAATATEKGTSERPNITLGEVQLIAAKANERIISIAKFYRLAHSELALKWYKMVAANKDTMKPWTLYRKGLNGKYVKKEVKASDFVNKEGYDPNVVSSSEQEQENLKQLQVLQVAKTEMPANVPLKKIYQKRLLQSANLNPDEIREITQFEEQQAQNPQTQGLAQPQPPPQPVPARTLQIPGLIPQR